MKLWLLLAFWLALALSTWGRSQSLEGASLEGASLEGISVPAGLLACTSGPYGAVGSPACLGPACIQSTVSNLSSVINSAVNGAVLCLQRGEVFSATTGLNLTASHPDQNRLTICASTGTTCTDSGAANPRISMTGSSNPALQFGVSGGGSFGVSGYTVKNLDLYGNNSSFSEGGLKLVKPSSHITIVGGVIDGFWQPIYADTGNDPVVDDISLGTCAAPLEIRGGDGGIPTGPGAPLRSALWGGLTNSHISVWVHNFFGAGSGSPPQNHMLDLGHNGTHTPTDSGHDLTVECSRFDYAGGNMGSFIKTPRGYNMVYRDNVFNVTANPSGGMAIAFDDHDAGGTEGVDGAQVYRNTIHGHMGLVMVGVGRNIDIFSNVADFAADDGTARGLVQLWYSAGHSDDLQIEGIKVFNNTVYRSGNSPPGSGWPVLMGANGGPDGLGRTPCTACELRNNLVVNLDATDSANIFEIKHTCAEFGTNGANIKSNFIYTPSDSSPALGWTGCSGRSGNSTTFATSPNLVNVGLGDFHPLLHTSPPCGFSTTAGPATDYEQLAFPTVTPFDVGAFRCPP